ncbi:hypothetical protein ACF0H5_021964 [Mactra antiquata]
MVVVKVLSLLFLANVSLAGVELFKNHDMENVNVNHDWTCKGGCTLTSSTDRYHGSHSVMVSNRHHDWSGLSQDVQLTAGSYYQLTAYIKLLNLAAGDMYESVQTKISCTLANGAHNCNFYIQINGPSVNYLVDNASFQLVPHNTNWKTEANARIEQIRKADISISLTGTQGHQYDVEITQTKHEFGFGSAVGAHQLVDPNYSNYAQAFYENFEWAVLENALKWRQMEKTQGHVVYDTAMNALHALNNKGIKVRAHNIFWGIDRHCPNWVLTTSKQDLPNIITKRINDVVSHTKNLVEHWDVNNENLHGDWFEEKLHDPNITMKMFTDTHGVDPDVKLFLNDFGVMEHGMAVPLTNQAKRFKDNGVPIYGIGVQSHIKNVDFDPSVFKLILDKVAEAGLPIWITELTLATTDENAKARALEDIYTLYFSHPSVEGVLLWGFWDGKIFNKNVALFEGANVTPNAAGRAYQTLFKTTWRTHVTKSLNSDGPITIRGFKGEYTINIKQNGHTIKSESFTLDRNGQSVQVDVGTNSPSIIVG